MVLLLSTTALPGAGSAGGATGSCFTTEDLSCLNQGATSRPGASPGEAGRGSSPRAVPAPAICRSAPAAPAACPVACLSVLLPALSPGPKRQELLRYLDELRAILQVLNYGNVEAVAPRGEWQRAAGHAGADTRVLGERFAEVAPGLGVLRPVTAEGGGGQWGPAAAAADRHTLTQRDGQRAREKSRKQRSGTTQPSESQKPGDEDIMSHVSSGARVQSGRALGGDRPLPRCPGSFTLSNAKQASLTCGCCRTLVQTPGENTLLLINRLPHWPGRSSVTACATSSTELLRADRGCRYLPGAKFKTHCKRKRKPLLE